MEGCIFEDELAGINEVGGHLFGYDNTSDDFFEVRDSGLNMI
jgi:hypothetical protein